MQLTFILLVGTPAWNYNDIQRIKLLPSQTKRLAHYPLYAVARHGGSDGLAGNGEAKARGTGVVLLGKQSEIPVARPFLRLIKNPLEVYC